MPSKRQSGLRVVPGRQGHMRMRLWIKASLILPALCLAGLTAYAQQQGSSQQQTSDPVADAARKAREEKKNAQKPKKVYTDDDVRHNLGGPAAPSSTSGTGSAGASSAGGAPASGEKRVGGEQKAGKEEKGEDPKSEAAWRKRFQDQREKIAKAERELDILQREAQKSQVEYYTDPQKAMTEQNSQAEVNEKMAPIRARYPNSVYPSASLLCTRVCGCSLSAT